MTITITPTGEHRHDQTSGPQTTDGKDELDLSVDLNELPDLFEGFLLSLSIPLSLRTNAATYDYAHEAPGSTNFFVNVATTEGEVINDLYFSQGDAAGSLFDGQLATYDSGTPMSVTGSSADIYLYSFLGGDVLIGSTDATVDITDPTSLDPSSVVFAYYLEENTSHTGADVYGVTFQPIDHPDAGDGTLGTHDEAIDLADFLHVSASGTLTFDFDELDSGKFLWVALGDDEAGLLVTGKDLNVQDPGHAKEGDRVNGGSDPSNSMNTSQGGVGATTGVNNQLYTAGNTGVFTLVTNFTPLGTTGPQATGDNVTEIDYTGFIDTVGASIFISQTQGGDPVNLTIDVFKAAGDSDGVETGFDYIGNENGNDGTSGAFEDDLDVNVKSVEVFSANGANLIGTWVIGTPGTGETGNGGVVAGPDGDVRVTITDSSIDVDGLQELYVVHWEVVDGSTFNRFQVTGDAENGFHEDTEFFDIGRVDVDKGLIVSENIGANVLIHDDGPAVALVGDGTAMLVLDESVGADASDPNAVDGAPLASQSITAAQYLTTNTSNAGTDGEKSDVWSFGDPAGADSGLVDTATGNLVFLFLETGALVGREGTDAVDAAGGDEVVRFTINSTNGTVTATQSRAVVHDDTGDHDKSTSPAMLSGIDKVVVNRVVTDGDDDTATATVDLTAIFKFEDDGPSLDIETKSGAMIALDETENDGDDTAIDGILAMAMASAADLFQVNTEDGGSDGQDTSATTYAFVDPGTDAVSGLTDSMSGMGVVYNLVSGDIVGTVDGGPDDGMEVIRYDIDASTGKVTATQTRAVVHGTAGDGTTPPNSHDETLTHPLSNLIVVNKTIFDNDGDSDSDTADITNVFKIDDDGPSLDIETKSGAMIALDETENDGDDTAIDGILAMAMASAADLFQVNTEDGGSDGQDTSATTYAFVDPGTDAVSGLTDSMSGMGVVYNLVSGDIVGTVDGGPDDGMEVIRYDIDASTGKVTATQTRAVVHGTAGDGTTPPNSHDETLTHPLSNLIVVNKTIFDNDGDSDSDTADITNVFKIDDDGPSLDIETKSGAMIALDETENDGDDTAIDGILAMAMASAADLFQVNTEDGGSDGQDTSATTYAFVDPGTDAVSGLTDSMSGMGVVYNLVSGDIVGTVDGGPDDGMEVIRYDIDASTGKVTATQTRAVVHGTAGDGTTPPNSHDETLTHPLSNLIVVNKTIFDNDGDSDSDTADITNVFKIDDDGPSLDIETKSGAMIALDETENDGDDTAIDGILAMAMASAADLFQVNTEDGGSDGQDTSATTYAFVDPGTDAVSGLTDSMSGMGVVYNLVSGDIVGTVDGGPDDGMEVIRYDIDASTGKVTATQTRAVVHGTAGDGTTPPNSHDETLTHPLSNLIVVNKTIFDNDGDSDSDTADITNVFKIDDDGPSLDIETKSGAMIALDETENDGDDTAIDGILAMAMASAADLFQVNTEDGGSDGQDTSATTYAFVDPGTDAVSGLTDSMSGMGVVYNLVSGDIVGTVDGGPDDGMEVIRYDIDASTGKVTATQTRAVVHGTAGDGTTPPNSHDETLTHPLSNLIVVNKTIFDNDGDSNSDTADITNVFKIDDDGPSLDIETKSGAMIALDETENDGDDTAIDGILAMAMASAADLFQVNTEDGGSDGQDTSATTYAFVDPGTDAVSGLTDSMSGMGVVYNLVSGDIVGTVDGGPDDGMEVIRYDIDASTGKVTATQTRAVVHGTAGDGTTPPNSHDETLTHPLSNLIVVNKTIFDNDGDSDSDTADITNVFKIDDDGPSIVADGNADPVLTTDDDDIGNPAMDTEDFSGLFGTPNYGSDGAATTNSLVYSLSVNVVGDDSGLVDSLTGDKILLRVNASGDVEGYLENATTTVAFLISVDADGNVTQTQNRSVFHDDPMDPDEDGAGEPETLSANIQVKLTATVTDGDGDTASAVADIGLRFRFVDDGPVIDITGGRGEAGGGVDGDLLVDFEVGSTDSALLGGVSGNDGYKSIKIVDYSGDGDDTGPAGMNGADLVVNDVTLTAELTNNGTLVNYFENIDGDPLVFDGNDILYYTYELKDLIDADGELDTAVFTVHDIPPASMPDFSLEDLPAGQNGFGILASRADDNPLTPLDPDGPALVIFGREAIADTDGTYTNASDTINTSKGGGPTTIGLKNQMIDPPSNKDDNGEGVFFVYVSDPVDDFVSSLPDDPTTPTIDEGLDQNEADDFDNIMYDGDLVETDGAFFSVVQVQGNPKTATARITAFDVEPEDGTPGVTLQGVDLVTHDFFSEDQIVITEVMVTREDEFGNVIEVYTAALGDGDTAFVNFLEAGEDPVYEGGVIVSGIEAGDTIHFKTLTDHDVALIEGLAGKFDIGDYGIDLFNPTPDQLLSFSNEITDNDDDTAVDTHYVGIDGTGDFDDDAVLF